MTDIVISENTEIKVGIVEVSPSDVQAVLILNVDDANEIHIWLTSLDAIDFIASVTDGLYQEALREQELVILNKAEGQDCPKRFSDRASVYKDD